MTIGESHSINAWAPISDAKSSQVLLYCCREELNISDNSGLREGPSCSWTTRRSQINNLRAQILDHTYDLSLCLSTIEE